MVRNYKPRHGTAREKPYTDEAFQEALRRVSDGESVNKVCHKLGIPRRSLRDRISGARPSNVTGRPRALLAEEEDCIASHVAALGDFGYAFNKTELRYFVKSYLDKSGRNVVQFTHNLPGMDWVDAFLKRNVQLTNGVCLNIGRKRTSVNVSEMDNFFDHLCAAHGGIPPENFVSCDETNLHDNPKGGKPQRAKDKGIQVEPDKNAVVADLQASTSGASSRKMPAKKIKLALQRFVHESSDSDVG